MDFDFLLAINIAMAIYAFTASFVFWFTWRERPDFLYLFIGAIIYSLGHTALILKHFYPIFTLIGNGIVLLALVIVVVSAIIEYFTIMVKSKKEQGIFWISIFTSFILGALTLVLFHIFNLLNLLNGLVISMIILLIPATVFILRIYMKNRSITRLFIFTAFISATLTAISTILSDNFGWGLALNIAFNFIFQTFIMTSGLAGIAERRVTASEEKYRNLSEHLEEKVVERTLQLENLNQELESFSYSVSHDLRTPLRGIAGFTKILNDEFKDELGAQGKEHIKRILDNTNRMDELINDLLDLAQISQSDFKIDTVNLSKLANEIIEKQKPLHKDRNIDFKIAADIVAQCDSRLIKIVLENLFSNAIKFTKLKEKAEIDFGVDQKENRSVYYVRDNGIGFEMQYYEKLFGLFQRLHSRSEYEGTGIGLITVKRIIDRHKGKIWAESEPEKETTFYFTLP